MSAALVENGYSIDRARIMIQSPRSISYQFHVMFLPSWLQGQHVRTTWKPNPIPSETNDVHTTYNSWFKSITIMLCINRYELQKKTTFLGLDRAGLANDLSAPECAPTWTSSRLFLCCSFLSALSSATECRLSVWKSSSSAPASRPVPSRTVLLVIASISKQMNTSLY